MKNFIRRWRWLAATALVAAAGYAWAQGITVLSSPVGTEQLTVYPLNANGGVGGTQAQVNINQIRNATGFQLINAATSGTISPTNAVDNVLINAQPNGATTINTPTSPFDGELFSVCNVSNAALAVQTVTLAAAAGSSLNTGVTTALTTLAARTCVELQYVASTTTWYQVR